MNAKIRNSIKKTSRWFRPELEHLEKSGSHKPQKASTIHVKPVNSSKLKTDKNFVEDNHDSSQITSKSNQISAKKYYPSKARITPINNPPLQSKHLVLAKTSKSESSNSQKQIDPGTITLTESESPNLQQQGIKSSILKNSSHHQIELQLQDQLGSRPSSSVSENLKYQHQLAPRSSTLTSCNDQQQTFSRSDSPINNQIGSEPKSSKSGNCINQFNVLLGRNNSIISEPSPQQQIGFASISTVTGSPSSQKQITPSSPVTVGPAPTPQDQVAESSSSYKSAKKYLSSKLGFGSKKSQSSTVQEKPQAQSAQSNKVVQALPTVSVESEDEKVYPFCEDNANASTGLQTPDSALSFTPRHTIATSSLRDHLPSDTGSSSAGSEEDFTTRLSPPTIGRSSRSLQASTTLDFVNLAKEKNFRGSVIDLLLEHRKKPFQQKLSPGISETRPLKTGTVSNRIKPESKTSLAGNGNDGTQFSPNQTYLFKQRVKSVVATDDKFETDEEHLSFVQATKQMTQFETPEPILASVKREVFSILLVSSCSYITLILTFKRTTTSCKVNEVSKVGVFRKIDWR